MIEVKRDHSLNIPDIITPMTSEGTRNNPSGVNGTTAEQSKVAGIIEPIIKIGNFTALIGQISYMELTCQRVPSIHIVLDDVMGITQVLDAPNNDNLLQLQIIPATDNTYRKINLQFYITDSSIGDSQITLDGIYYAPRLYDNVMKAYGQISTYELFDSVSSEYGLGFSSNISDSSDVRWIYNPNHNVLELLGDQIDFSGANSSDVTTQDVHVFDWWIGWWNELNLVDVYNEYRDVVPDDKMKVWVESAVAKIASDEKSEAEEMLRMFTNAPHMTNSQIYMRDSYTPNTQIASATDINFEVYYMENIEQISTVVMDGDIKNNIRMAYEYGGEVFGEYDYLTRRACRNILYSKINGNCIDVVMRYPLFGYPKGSKVNVYWFDVNNHMTSEIQDEANKQLNSNIPVPDSLKMDDAKFIINKTISGQYYIIDTTLIYDYGHWEHKFTLGRPADQVQRIRDIAGSGEGAQGAQGAQTATVQGAQGA